MTNEQLEELQELVNDWRRPQRHSGGHPDYDLGQAQARDSCADTLGELLDSWQTKGSQIDQLIELEKAIAVANCHFENKLREAGYVFQYYSECPEKDPVVRIAIHPDYYWEVNELKPSPFFRSDLKAWCQQQAKGVWFVLSGKL